MVSITNAAKYARVYVTVVMVLIGLFRPGGSRFGIASYALLAYTSLYICAASWSYSPFFALVYKSFFGFSILAGLLMAHGTPNREDLLRGLRFAVVTMGLVGLLLFVVFLSNPQASLQMGRMATGGINANRIGGTAAPVLVLCCYLFLYDKSRMWKALGCFVALLMALIIVYSGSRSAAGSAVIGAGVLALPLLKRPIVLALFALGAIGFGVLAVNYIETEAVSRLTDTTDVLSRLIESRTRMWKHASEAFEDSPLLGQGFVESRRVAFFNLHSLYLQVLAETGVIGALIFAASLVIMMFRALRSYLIVRIHRPLTGLASLMIAIILSTLATGMAESNLLAGTMPQTLLFGFAVGMVDRLPALSMQEHRQTARRLILRQLCMPARFRPKPT